MGEEATLDWHFDIISGDDLAALTNLREGETKLGEKLLTLPVTGWEELLQQSPAKYVLIGIPEDIGVRANGGVGGAHTLWAPFLKAFCNIQHTHSLQGEQVILLGAFNFDKLMAASIDKDMAILREMVRLLDEAIYPVIETICRAGKLPIIIGGGHNNCYPLIKGASKAAGLPVNSINLDAHSDYRVLEGRHSGNGFRYARSEGYLSRYAIVGLHRNYNSQQVLDIIQDDPGISASFYEDIFFGGQPGFEAAIAAAVDFTGSVPTGIELDVDCIAGVLSSAATPAGITALQARQYLDYCGKQAAVAYVHITEGAVTLRDGRMDNSTAKLVAYLVADFLRAHQKR
jgi:formiminoglutamase